MPVRGNTFKIFIGNLSDRVTPDDVRKLFSEHGTVVEADVVKNYGFVHMETEEEGLAAIKSLNGYSLHGKQMVVEASTGSRKQGNQRTKIFIGNIDKDTTVEELRSLFEDYGAVVEADILNNFAFLHMTDDNLAQRAIRELDGYELRGHRLRVQQSTSRVRQQAGMGNPDLCYRCGSAGHWSKECPRDSRSSYPERERERPRSYASRYDPYPPPPPAGYGRERMAERMSSSRYRVMEDDPYAYDRYGSRYDHGYDLPYERRSFPHPDPPMLEYERRMAPMPSHASDYLRYGRRSPPARYPPPPPMRSFAPSDHRF